MRQTNLQGEVVKEWLAKWPNLPSKQLARMIYNSDDNNKLFNSAEHVRTSIRYYRGACGNKNRQDITTNQFLRPFKIIVHE